MLCNNVNILYYFPSLPNYCSDHANIASLQSRWQKRSIFVLFSAVPVSLVSPVCLWLPYHSFHSSVLTHTQNNTHTHTQTWQSASYFLSLSATKFLEVSAAPHWKQNQSHCPLPLDLFLGRFLPVFSSRAGRSETFVWPRGCVFVFV